MARECQWQGNVVQVDQQTASVTLYGLQEQGHQWQLSPTRLCNLPLRADHVQACEVAEDSSSGVRVPFVLITHQLGASQLASGRACTHELLVCNVNASGRGGNLESYSRFDVPKSYLPDDAASYVILDGPTVVWNEGAQIHMACSTATNPGSMLQQSFGIQDRMFIGEAAESGTEFSVGCFWAFNWLGNGTDAGNTLLLFIIASPVSAWNEDQDDMEFETRVFADSPRQFWLCLQVVAVSESGDLQVTRLSDSLVPSDYGFIATCIALNRSYSVNDSGEMFSKFQFVVGTSYQQVVVFENGAMLHCIHMQCTPERIYTMESSDGDFAFAAWGRNNDVFVVKVAEKKHQECGTWKDVSGLLVGDFASIGHEQLLLIFNGGTLSKFYITDLAQFTANSEMVQHTEATRQPCAESLVSALKALQVRKKSGEAYLTTLERETQEKTLLLGRSVKFLKSLGRLDASEVARVPKPDPTLICLLPGAVNVGILQEEVKPETETNCYPGLKVLQSWQRIIDGQWLVGIVAENALECPVQDIRLSLVPTGSRIPQESSSRVVSMEKDSTSWDRIPDVPPEAKRQKLSVSDMPSSSNDAMLLPGRKFCIVVKTALPVFSGGTAKAVLVCSWKKLSGVRCDLSCEVVELGGVVLSMEQVTAKSLQCSKDCLTMWKGEKCLPYTRQSSLDKDNFQDLSCLLTARSFVQVVAKSTFTDLLRLPAMLKARLPLPSHAVSTSITAREPPGTGESAARSLEILDGVLLHVHFHHNDVHSASINILYKNTSQLSFLIEAMRSVLPEDVSIEATGTNCQEGLATCLKLLGKELRAKSVSVEQKLQQLKGSSSQTCAKSDPEQSISELAAQTNSAIVNLLCAP